MSNLADNIINLSVGDKVYLKPYERVKQDVSLSEDDWNPLVEAFYAGNAIKYILRWDKKNGVEDLEKAKVYIDKIIEGRKEK